jgi:glucose dehydrogenase
VGQFTTECKHGLARKPAMAVLAGTTLLTAALLVGSAVTADAASPNASGNRFVEQKQITVDNVSGLKPAWKFTIPDDSVIEGTPVEADGLVYITSAHDDIYALDAKSGKLEWSVDPKVKQIVGVSANRGVALLDGKLYLAGLDGHTYAFDAKTGKKLWDKLTVQQPEHQFYTQQPLV